MMRWIAALTLALAASPAAAMGAMPISYYYGADGAPAPGTDEQLNEAARQWMAMGSEPGCVVIVGSTDTVGDAAENLRLSLRRAEWARDQLMARGVSEGVLRVAGLGETNLLIPTDDETPEPRNRRVEIFLNPAGCAPLRAPEAQ
jgi:hypothetical protein